MSAQLETLEQLIKDHFRRVTKAWPRDPAGDWARELVQRIERQELSTVSLLAHGKMGQSLTDGQRHSAAISTDDLFIAVSTFPCSIAEAQRKHYPQGYLTYLDRMVAISRQENPGCHWLHFQFFCDGASFWVQFTLFPNRNVLDFAPMYHLPTDLLDGKEKARVGLG